MPQCTDKYIIEELSAIRDGIASAERDLHNASGPGTDRVRADLRDLTWQAEDLITSIKEAH